MTSPAPPARPIAHAPPRYGDARQVAGQIAVRAADPAVLARAVAALGPADQPGPRGWRPASLAQGRAGLAVLCAELDAAQPGAGWDAAGHRHLIAASAVVNRHDGSLFAGLAGLGFAATLLAAGRPRYGRLLRQVDDALEPLLDAALGRLALAGGCRVGDFDLVSGLTGMGVYLLTRRELEPPAAGGPPAGARPAMLARLLGGLARLMAQPGDPRPWHTPATMTAGSLRSAYPSGLHNCGLAHGAPGPLALLALARLAGVAVPEGLTAIEMTASWLAAHQCGTAAEPDWPDGVPLGGTPSGQSDAQRCGPGRAAWCYGALGVARSLWLAGAAAGEPQWQDLAVRAVTAVAARPPDAWGHHTPGFCHGTAGLAQLLHRFAADLADPGITAAADLASAELASRFEAGLLLGVRSVDPDGEPVDQPGLLEGASGIALALLGVPAAAQVPGAGRMPGWDRMFLLA